MTELNATVSGLTATQALGVALSVQAGTMIMYEAQERGPDMLAHLQAMGFDVVPLVSTPEPLLIVRRDDLTKDSDPEHDFDGPDPFSDTPETVEGLDPRVVEAFDRLGGMWSWSEDNGYFWTGTGWVMEAGRLLREVVGRPAQPPSPTKND